jgi:hypothetical protein
MHPTQLGSYDIVARIAEGGMGTVYKARHRQTGAVVAVKVIAAATAKNPVLLQRFEREFQAARVLDHPNVVRAIEYCGAGPQPFLVMEYVDGESVGQRVERAGAFPEAEAVRLVAQVCEGLQRAHKQGLVHRDVKPDNILVTRDGVAKLTDLGLVRDVDGDLNLTKTGRGLGTPHYMAPEQFRSAKTVDVRGDVYSLGATLYAMVTGRVPFENASPLDCWMKKIRNEFPAPRELAPGLSDRVDWAIRRAMSAEPDRRPASCREFLEDLTGQGRGAPPRDPAAADGADVWYLVYRDEAGEACTVKGTTGAIRNALRDRLLGDAAAVLVSRAKAGPFVSLASAPEFRDLVVDPAPLSGPTPLPASASGRHRRPADEETAEYGADPSAGGRAGLPPGRASGARAGIPGRTAAPLPTPLPVADPADDTAPYAAGEADRPTKPLRRKPARARKKAFDWTPVLLAVVAVLSAVVGYLVLAR